ncbi:hypothetical protein [Campylobacter mucosalis]|nr:hypothetical protein [Campylobacter mucosalis]
MAREPVIKTPTRLTTAMNMLKFLKTLSFCVINASATLKLKA